ncbi:MAG: hypothetical protein AAB354_13845, partial [candidate division KSB1 bacterium]
MTLSTKKELLHRHLVRLAARLERRIATLERLSRNFSRARLALVLLGALATYVAGQALGANPGWLVFLLAAFAFIFLARRHERVERSLARHRIWLRLKAEHNARMTLDWEKLPKPAHAPVPAAPPFASDLNLVGERALLHLLDTTTGTGGSARLREWLLQPLTDPARIAQRQAIIQELKPLARFRDHLALQGALLREDIHERWEGEKLAAWLKRDSAPRALRKWVLGLLVLAFINLALFALHALELAPLLWPYTLILYAYAYVLRLGDLSKLFDEAFLVEKKLRPFQTVARYLERHPFTRHAHLMQLCAPFRQAGRRPSEHLHRATRIAEAASMQRGQLFWLLLNILVPWDFYFWYRLETTKAELRTNLPRWLEAWYELEAYNALANFAYLNPDYIFPHVQSAATPALLQARGLGHPLLPEATRVSNDITIDRLGEIVLITGSNMSGK